jgi:hypothetical protein
MTYCESGDLSAAIKEQRRKGALPALAAAFDRG